MRYLIIGFLAVTNTIASGQATGAVYSVTDLGTLSGGQSEAFGLNSFGHVVGWANLNPGVQAGHAFLSDGGAMIDLGTLPIGNQSYAYAVNDAGQIVGGSGPGADQYHAFLYENGTMMDLGTFGGGYSWARDINNSGIIVGHARYSDKRTHAFIYQNGSMMDIGTLGGFGIGYSSDAYAINDAGYITGNSSWNSSGELHAIIYYDGVMTDIGTLGGNAAGKSINNLQQVVGQSIVPGGEKHAFLYDGASMIDIHMSTTFANSIANDINNHGQIVGQCWNGSDRGHGVYFDSTLGIIPLEDLLPSDLGWTITNAYAINDSGQIAAWGQLNGSPSHAVLLSPIPEPSILTLLTAGFLGLTLCRLRHQNRTRLAKLEAS